MKEKMQRNFQKNQFELNFIITKSLVGDNIRKACDMNEMQVHVQGLFGHAVQYSAV